MLEVLTAMSMKPLKSSSEGLRNMILPFKVERKVERTLSLGWTINQS